MRYIINGSDEICRKFNVATHQYLCFYFDLVAKIYFIDPITTNFMYLFIKSEYIRPCIMYVSEGELFLPTAGRYITGPLILVSTRMAALSFRVPAPLTNQKNS
jgi:hypothetical protein